MTITIKARTFDDGDAYHAVAEDHGFGAISRVSRGHAINLLVAEVEQAHGWKIKATRLMKICGVTLSAILTFDDERRDDLPQP